MLALQAEEVVLADQEGPICDENETLLLVVPVVDPGKKTRPSCRGFGDWLEMLLTWLAEESPRRTNRRDSPVMTSEILRNQSENLESKL